MSGTVPLLCADRLAEIHHGEGDQTRVCLVRMYPASASGALTELRGPRMTMGRDPQCDVEIPDDCTSRVHAILEQRDGFWTLTDHGSLNGTYVNDLRVERHRLSHGDQLRVGNHIYKVLASDEIELHYHEAMYGMMVFDALTQTYNRRYFEDDFRREVTRSIRHHRPLALLLLDVDDFKTINDRYGHLVGDEVLARYGGEEFSLTLAEISLMDALGFSEELRRVVADCEFETSQGAVPVTVSIGVAHYDGLSQITYAEIIAQADARLYEAKSAGRNCVRW
jgi:GGDEF domain-containing protein